MHHFYKQIILSLIITFSYSFSNAQVNTWENFKYFEVTHPFQDYRLPAPVFDKDGNLWHVTTNSLIKIKGADTTVFHNFPSAGVANRLSDLSACGNHITFFFEIFPEEEETSRWHYYIGYYNGKELKFFPDTLYAGIISGGGVQGVVQTSDDIWIDYVDYTQKHGTLRLDKQKEKVVNKYDIHDLGRIDTNELIGAIGKDYYLWDFQNDTRKKILPDDDEIQSSGYSDSTQTLYSVGRKRLYIYANKELRSYDKGEFGMNTGVYEVKKDMISWSFKEGFVLMDKEKLHYIYAKDLPGYTDRGDDLIFGINGSWFLDNGILILSLESNNVTFENGYSYAYNYFSYYNGELKFEAVKPYWQSTFFYKTLTGDRYFYHTNYDWFNEPIIPNVLTIEKNNEPPITLTLPEQIPYSMSISADSNYVWIYNDVDIESPYRIWRMRPDLGYVKGNVFYDANRNGIRDSNEVGVSKYPLVIKPGNMMLYPDVNGNYGFGNFMNKNYTLEIPADSLFDYVSSSLPLALTISDTNNVGLTLKEPQLNVDPNFCLPRARCNETETAHLNLNNNGFGTIDKLKLTLIGDSLTILESYEATERREDTLVFEVTNLRQSERKIIDYEITFPDGEYVGEILKFKIIADIYSNGTLVKSISDSLETIVRCSFDPNDKAVTPAGVGKEKLTLKNIPLDYLIRFENTGNDIAYTVTVYDTLDSNLDPSTIKILGSSHPVNTNVLSGGKVIFHFENIMLPDSTTNKEKAQGFVRFSVKPLGNLPEEQVIKNKAGIVFDRNTPVITNEVYNTLVTKIPNDYVPIKGKKNNISVIYPNPATNVVHLRGSGGTSVEVYDFTGKKIFNSQNSSINTSDWQNGLYIFRVLDANGDVLNTEKVLISK